MYCYNGAPEARCFAFLSSPYSNGSEMSRFHAHNTGTHSFASTNNILEVIKSKHSAYYATNSSPEKASFQQETFMLHG